MTRLFRALGVRYTALLMTALFVLVVALQNLDPVSIRVLFWRFLEVPKLYLVLGAFLTGGFLGYAAGTWQPARPKGGPPEGKAEEA